MWEVEITVLADAREEIIQSQTPKKSDVQRLYELKDTIYEIMNAHYEWKPWLVIDTFRGIQSKVAATTQTIIPVAGFTFPFIFFAAST